MDDASDESLDTVPSEESERIAKLGFRPQKELWVNKYLPCCANQVDDESATLLASIKQNLVDAIINKEMNPGLGIFASRLMSYMKLYGLKFSKEDHIQFIKILLELMCIPNLEPSKLNKFCTVANQLLNKSYLLSPDELQINWKPLYGLSKIYLRKNSNKCVMHRFFVTLENNLNFLISRSTIYFPKSATQEILDELFTTMEPLDTGKGCEVFGLLTIFLNTYDGYDLWLEKFITLWNVYHNPTWNSDVMNLVGAVARNNVGRIDWEPHIPTIFTRILRCLELPVSYKNMSSNQNQSLWSSSVANWIVAVLGPKSSGQRYLDNFMATIESYVHPANTGKWVEKISELLSNLLVSFERRLYDERFRRPCWTRPIPEEHKLTEKCITDFVMSIRPVAMQAIYSRMNVNDVGTVFKILAELRPELIIPGIIEKVYSSLDLLTKPHKLTTALQTLVKVARPLVCGHNGYTEGKTHVIPIMMSLLPGIDPNDFKKTALVLQYYVSFSILVPLVDCSKADQFYDDLTDEERLICEQSAMMEDFVLQFLDRIFVLVDSNSVQSIRMDQSDADNNMSRLEAIAETSIISSVHTILSQSSEEIIQAATRKTVHFVKTNIFEPKVAGVLVGGLVRIMGRVAGDSYFRLIVPYLINTLEEYFDEHEDIAEAEKQNNEVLYYLLLLLNVVRGDPKIVINYIDTILPVIDRVLTFKCPQANTTANNMILYIMGNFSTIQTDFVSYPEMLTKPLSEFLPIRHWGATLKPTDKINWYIPDERSRKLCETILYRYLPKTLDFFEKYISDESTPTREEMLKNINLLSALLRSNNMLPNWEEKEPLKMIDTVVKDFNFHLTLGFENKSIHMPDGSSIRLKVIDSMTRLQEKLLEKSEDDIKSLKAIIQVWERVHMKKHGNPSYDVQLKNYFLTKSFQEHRLTHQKRSIRCVVSLRTLIQQNCRDELAKPRFTRTHVVILKNLLKLSTSKYSSIRLLAQSKLVNILTLYAFSYRCIVDDIVELLRLDTEEHHDRFKGALYILNGHRNCRLLVKRDWECVRKLWMALLESKVSEKPSITKLIDALIDVIKFDFPTLNIRLKIPQNCVETALKLAPAPFVPSPEELEEGNRREVARNDKNTDLYYQILNDIINIVKNNSLHWRYNFMASSMLLNLVHPAVQYPELVARYFIHGLLNDLLPERKIATVAMGYVLLQQKREHKKIVVDPFKIAGVERTDSDLLPGIRKDNKWLQYDLERVPRNQDQWDENRFMYKPHGYFGWRKTVEMYAPTKDQPNLDWSRSDMTSIQQLVFDFFSDSNNVDKLIKFWSLEGKKGRDKFNQSQFYIVRSIFGMFGDVFAENFLKHLPKLIAEKQYEGNHRCAAEIIGGMIRATKHWPYAMAEKMFTKLTPLIQMALSNITTETDMFWGGCFAVACEAMDPLRQHWLYEVLLDEPLRQSTSYIDCSRILCLQGAYNEHVWRLNSVSHRLLAYFTPYLSHPFQNVRETIGNILINIFEVDFKFPGANEPEGPRMAEFIAEVLTQIQILNNEFPATVINNEESAVETVTLAQDSEFYTAVRLFKTIAHWVMVYINRSTNGNRVEFFELLPFACRLERCEQDTELAMICSKLLAMISQALTLADCMSQALDKVDVVSKMSFWSARLSVIGVLQVLVFNNMSIVLSSPEWVERVQNIVLRLLEDNVLEVREKAAQVLGGLLHCSFLPATDQLLELFKKKCRTKVKGRQRAIEAMNQSGSRDGLLLETCDAVRVRHTGVLGLCAFISAYPYDIPDFVPDVFEHLGAHLNDPQPIPSTIRKTVGDFKRTHLDNWENHQLKFTVNQLAVLTDLTVPPTYYV